MYGFVLQRPVPRQNDATQWSHAPKGPLAKEPRQAEETGVDDDRNDKSGELHRAVTRRPLAGKDHELREARSTEPVVRRFAYCAMTRVMPGRNYFRLGYNRKLCDHSVTSITEFIMDLRVDLPRVVVMKAAESQAVVYQQVAVRQVEHGEGRREVLAE